MDAPNQSLPPTVLTRLEAELGARGLKAGACLRTASALLAQAHEDPTLRLAESAAYNLREALDAVTAGRSAAGGGIDTVAKAWRSYRTSAAQPDADEDALRADLYSVLEVVASDDARQTRRSLILLEYLRDQAGIEPLSGEHDPVRTYRDLLARANTTLHESGTIDGVASLYDQTVSWFVLLFTPPDARVNVLVEIAKQAYSEGALVDLRRQALNAHHLSLFLSGLTDPEWLAPLVRAGIIGLPTPGEIWPLWSLIGGTGAIEAGEIASVLDLLLEQANREPADRRLSSARELIQAAGRLGPSGHGVVAKVLARFGGDRWIQMTGSSISKHAAPEESIQLAIADAVVGSEDRHEGTHRSERVLAQVLEGLTASNVVDRIRMTAGKLRRLGSEPNMRLVVIDAAPLDANDDEAMREPVLVVADYFVRMVPSARDLGVPTAELLALVDGVDRELKERLTCRLLAGANDVDRITKVRHVAQRLQSRVATGDDRYLLEDVVSEPLTPAEISLWQVALGHPAEPDASGLGRNWPQAWRWSILLPPEVLDGWQAAIGAVSARHGTPDPQQLSTRIPRFLLVASSSPISTEELEALTVEEAATAVSAWRPSPEGSWVGGALELAGALGEAVKNHPSSWTTDPAAIVTILREPIYIDHYLQAVREKLPDVLDATPRLFDAIRTVRHHRWAPSALDDNGGFEVDWSGVDREVVDLVAALAWRDAPFGSDLDTAWHLSSEVLGGSPPDTESDPSADPADDEFSDAFHRAINGPAGSAMEAAVAIGCWEHRNLGDASPRLTAALDTMLIRSDTVGAELRAIAARRRPQLETVASTWLDLHARELFGASPLGQIAFDQTLKYSRPTKWFYERFRSELLDAAAQRLTNAISWTLVAYLHEEPGYTFDAIVGRLGPDGGALHSLAHDLAQLVRTLKPDSPAIEQGVQFWRSLVQADRGLVPAEALIGLGRWTLVEHVDDDVWEDLTHATLSVTSGEIDMAVEIAERCKERAPSGRVLRMLRLMLGHGEPWERHQVDVVALEVLRSASALAGDEEFDRLRMRLIERGQHDAASGP